MTLQNKKLKSFKVEELKRGYRSDFDKVAPKSLR